MSVTDGPVWFPFTSAHMVPVVTGFRHIRICSRGSRAASVAVSAVGGLVSQPPCFFCKEVGRRRDQGAQGGGWLLSIALTGVSETLQKCSVGTGTRIEYQGLVVEPEVWGRLGAAFWVLNLGRGAKEKDSWPLGCQGPGAPRGQGWACTQLRAS